MFGMTEKAGTALRLQRMREHFTVTVGSVMERSKIPLTKWAGVPWRLLEAELRSALGYREFEL